MQPPRSLEPQVRRALHAVSTLREARITRSIKRSHGAGKSEPLLLNNKTSRCSNWPAQGRLGLSSNPRYPISRAAATLGFAQTDCPVRRRNGQRELIGARALGDHY